MKSVLVLALAGSAVAAPSLADFLDALFGGGDSNDNRPQPSDYPGLPPFGTGSGVPFPFPTATGAPFPTDASGDQSVPYPGSYSQEKRNIKPLRIDYELAPKATSVVKRRELKYRQLGSSVLPSFSLLDPNDTPTATEPATDLPTELPTELPTSIPTYMPSEPTGLPSPSAGGPTALLPIPTGEASAPYDEAPYLTDAPFPTAPAGTGAPDSPGSPTTLGTMTRGPKPTAAPDAPGQEGEERENLNGWLEWINDLLTGGRESQN